MCLLEQYRDGQQADSGWKSKAWERALEAVLKVAPESQKPNINTGKLKTKEQYFKGLYRDWKWLTSQSRFRVDPRTGVITASDEA